ncbi:TPA: hypothetical protein ACH27V_005661, partial [Klebsiella quasipneumoniae subsp. similipneumoniae]
IRPSPGPLAPGASATWPWCTAISASTIGAGGIGYLAVVYGYQRFDNHIMIATIVALIATIQVIQFLGDRLVNRLRHTQGNLV